MEQVRLRIGDRLTETRVARVYRRQGSGYIRSQATSGAQRHQADTSFLLRFHSQDLVHITVDESGQKAGLLAQRIGGCQQIRENRAIIPEAVTVPPSSVLPGAAPEDRRADDSGEHCRQRIVGSSSGQVSPEISFSQLGEGIIGGSVVVDPGGQSRKVAADQVKLDWVERPCRCGGPVVDLPRGRRVAFSDQPGGVVQQLGHRLQIQRPGGG